jgi:hypothetical protein
LQAVGGPADPLVTAGLRQPYAQALKSMDFIHLLEREHAPGEEIFRTPVIAVGESLR